MVPPAEAHYTRDCSCLVRVRWVRRRSLMATKPNCPPSMIPRPELVRTVLNSPCEAGHPHLLRQLCECLPPGGRAAVPGGGCRRGGRGLPPFGGREAAAQRSLCSPHGADALDPLLRVFEGCARAYLGEIAGANLIKLHRQSGKVSYLVYPSSRPTPPRVSLERQLTLRTRQIDCLEYGSSPNPPILHRKETFLLADHPLHARFARLSTQEEKHGLLADTASIGTRDGWNARLSGAGFTSAAGTGSFEGGSRTQGSK